MQGSNPRDGETSVFADNSQRSAGSSITAPTSGISWVKPAAYGVLNIAAATGIVFANKAVLSIYGFEFTTALTLLHTLTTVLGMTIFCQLGLFSPKSVPTLQVRVWTCAVFCMQT